MRARSSLVEQSAHNRLVVGSIPTGPTNLVCLKRENMGTFNVSIQVGNRSGDEFRPVEALVDTGASHTMLPGNLLASLGVVAIERVAFHLADERTVEYVVGEARIRLDGRERTTLVIFGPDDAEPLLGATTLQLFNMAVDTVSERLFSVPGLLKGLLASDLDRSLKPNPEV